MFVLKALGLTLGPKHEYSEWQAFSGILRFFL